MDPGWVIWKYFWLYILNGSWLGDLKIFLVGNCDGEALGDQMDFWLGGQKKDVARSTIRVRGQGMCGLDV